jgi:hypothetical protein
LADEVVRKLTITADTSGVDEGTASLKRFADAANSVADVTDTSSRKQVSAQAAYEKQTRAVVDGAAGHAKYTAAVKVTDSALAQGIITQADHTARIGLLKTKYLDSAEGAGTFAKAIEEAKHKLAEMGGEAGAAGQLLMSFGGYGLAAAAAIGTLLFAYTKFTEKANEQGNWARQLAQTAETLQLTTLQLQGLNEVASNTGIHSDELATGLQRMQVQMSQLKRGSGTLFDELSRGNKELRNQLGNAKDAAEQMDILATAYAKADDAQKKLIERAAFGRNGAQFGRFLSALDSVGGTGGAITANAADAIPKKMAEEWKELKREIDSATESANRNFATLFTTTLLTSEKQFAENMLIISREVKGFTMPEGLKKFFDYLTNPTLLLVLSGLTAVATVAMASTGVGLIGAAGLGIVSGALATAGMSAMKLTPHAAEEAPHEPTRAWRSGYVDQGAESQKANLAIDAADAQKLVQQLGAAATFNDRFNATIKETNSLLAQKEISKSTADRIKYNAELERSTAAHAAHTAALGQSATVADQVQAKQDQLNKLQQQGAGLTREQVAFQLQLTASQALGTFQLDAQTAAEKLKTDTLFMGKEAALVYLTVQTKINEQKALGITLSPAEVASFTASAEAMAKAKTTADNYAETFSTLKNAGGAFANSLIQGLVSGKSLMESLGASARQLSQTLTSSAITMALSGNLVGAAVAGVGAVISGIFGASEAEDEANAKRAQEAADAAAKAIKDAQDRTKQYNDMAAQSGFDTNTIAGQIAAFDSNAQQMRADEAEKGNGAILALETSLAKQRQAIVEKGNQAIAKSLNDFLNSIKTGASSILSPEDQLKYAQGRFAGDVSAANNGDEAALARITQDAQNLLDIAKSFYASTSGYTTIYQGVTDAISGLASHDNIHVAALAPNTAVAANDPLKKGGLQDGMAAGGIVGNGKYNVDSVMASYAGGGNIALAGGEYVTRASSVNASTMGMLAHINRTGKAPGSDSGDIARILTQGFNGQTMAIVESLNVLAERIKRVEDATRQSNNQRRVPGSTMKAA